MFYNINTVSGLPSLPSRERGLKPRFRGHKTDCPLSLPSRERGLKQKSQKSSIENMPVAPLAGAWIETLYWS